MVVLLDVNVLLYTHREEISDHLAYRFRVSLRRWPDWRIQTPYFVIPTR